MRKENERFIWEPDEKDHFETVGVDAMIILKWISGGYTEQWIHLAQDEVR
jgi:hypothetical protein